MSFWDNVKKFAQPYSDDEFDDYEDDDYMEDYVPALRSSCSKYRINAAICSGFNSRRSIYPLPFLPSANLRRSFCGTIRIYHVSDF